MGSSGVCQTRQSGACERGRRPGIPSLAGAARRRGTAMSWRSSSHRRPPRLAGAGPRRGRRAVRPSCPNTVLCVRLHDGVPMPAVPDRLEASSATALRAGASPVPSGPASCRARRCTAGRRGGDGRVDVTQKGRRRFLTSPSLLSAAHLVACRLYPGGEEPRESQHRVLELLSLRNTLTSHGLKSVTLCPFRCCAG